jgi:hypothetical protein
MFLFFFCWGGGGGKANWMLAVPGLAKYLLISRSIKKENWLLLSDIVLLKTSPFRHSYDRFK